MRGVRSSSQRGRHSGALGPLRDAQRVWLALDAPYEIARTRLLVSRACADLGDDETARLELEAAQEIFERLGAAPDLARLAGRKTDAHGLSPRELEVLRLVASGKTNRDDRLDARHQRAHRRAAPAEHIPEDRRLLTLRGDRVRVRKRPRLSAGVVVRTDH